MKVIGEKNRKISLLEEDIKKLNGEVKGLLKDDWKIKAPQVVKDFYDDRLAGKGGGDEPPWMAALSVVLEKAPQLGKEFAETLATYDNYKAKKQYVMDRRRGALPGRSAPPQQQIQAPPQQRPPAPPPVAQNPPKQAPPAQDPRRVLYNAFKEEGWEIPDDVLKPAITVAVKAVPGDMEQQAKLVDFIITNLHQLTIVRKMAETIEKGSWSISDAVDIIESKGLDKLDKIAGFDIDDMISYGDEFINHPLYGDDIRYLQRPEIRRISEEVFNAARKRYEEKKQVGDGW